VGSAWAAIVGAVIGAGGAILVQRIANGSEQQRWMRDKMREEYRELLDAIARYSKSALRLAALNAGGPPPIGPIAGATLGANAARSVARRRLERASDLDERALSGLIQDRLFVPEDVQRQLRERFDRISHALRGKGASVANPTQEIERFWRETYDTAKRDLGVTK
jgi:hypothetical protein